MYVIPNLADYRNNERHSDGTPNAHRTFSARWTDDEDVAFPDDIGPSISLSLHLEDLVACTTLQVSDNVTMYELVVASQFAPGNLGATQLHEHILRETERLFATALTEAEYLHCSSPVWGAVIRRVYGCKPTRGLWKTLIRSEVLLADTMTLPVPNFFPPSWPTLVNRISAYATSMATSFNNP